MLMVGFGVNISLFAVVCLLFVCCLQKPGDSGRYYKIVLIPKGLIK